MSGLMFADHSSHIMTLNAKLFAKETEDSATKLFEEIEKASFAVKMTICLWDRDAVGESTLLVCGCSKHLSNRKRGSSILFSFFQSIPPKTSNDFF